MSAWSDSAIAQNSNIVTGVVQDSSGIPVSGVSVVLKGSNKGVTTNESGSYTLKIPSNGTSGTLVFSSVGYLTKILPIPSSGVLNVALIPKTNQLSDVVVIGYSTKKKVTLTGAVNQISSKDIENKPVLNTLQALQGESPNLIIQQSQLDPGSNVTLNIRGVGTLAFYYQNNYKS